MAPQHKNAILATNAHVMRAGHISPKQHHQINQSSQLAEVGLCHDVPLQNALDNVRAVHQRLVRDEHVAVCLIRRQQHTVPRRQGLIDVPAHKHKLQKVLDLTEQRLGAPHRLHKEPHVVELQTEVSGEACVRVKYKTHIEFGEEGRFGCDERLATEGILLYALRLRDVISLH